MKSILHRYFADITATTIGILCQASEIIKWTDVDGIMNANPSQYDYSSSLLEISLEELIDLSEISEGILVHPDALRPLLREEIPLRTKNTFNLSFDRISVLKGLNTESGNIIAKLDGYQLVRYSSHMQMASPKDLKRPLVFVDSFERQSVFGNSPLG
ncbi:MAG: hypothetical protein R8G66_26150 [Cytophagales bacterium]|nr:hypothetical protein [Cytophagales bacterium]